MASQTFVAALFLSPFFTVIFKNTILVDWLKLCGSQKLVLQLVRKFNFVQTWFAIFVLAKCNGFKTFVSDTLWFFSESPYLYISNLRPFFDFMVFIRLAGYFSESPICDSAVSGNLDELALPNFFLFCQQTNYPEKKWS